MDKVRFNNKTYPGFQAEGNAARFAIPFAESVCRGKGLDIGYCKPEWKLEGAIGVDLADDTPYHANNLPPGKHDYIFSSHCLEHVDNWVETLELWLDSVRSGGTLFLYLPDFSQEYWRPWHNRKHKHCLTPEILRGFFEDKGYADPVDPITRLWVSERDLNNSFMVLVEVM